MLDLSPAKLLVLGLVGLIVMGPDKLPGLARDAARMVRTLGELSSGARNQLKTELAPELADVDLSVLADLRSLNPRTALTTALFDDDPGRPASPAAGTAGDATDRGPATGAAG